MEIYFRNVFYFLRRGRNNIQNMTVIISGNDYVLYSMLKVYNVSLNIILREVYSHSESNNRYFTSDLENRLKQTYVKTVNLLRTNIHNKDGITHSLTHSRLFSPFTFESSIFRVHFSLLHTRHVFAVTSYLHWKRQSIANHLKFVSVRYK